MAHGCDYCDRPGFPVQAMCAHEHLVDLSVCALHVDFFTSGIGTNDGNIHCPVCAWGVQGSDKHWCYLTRLPSRAA
jgi:hypothetical protein